MPTFKASLVDTSPDGQDEPGKSKYGVLKIGLRPRPTYKGNRDSIGKSKIASVP